MSVGNDGSASWRPRAVALLLVAVMAQPASALPSRVHAVLAYEAAQMPGVPAEFASAAVIGSPDNPAGDDRGNSICEGAFDEDYERVPRTIFDLLDLSNPDLIWGQGSHFWNPAGGPFGGRLRVFNPPPAQNAYERGTMLYAEAVARYGRDPARAYYLLGRVSHLLTDMATPAHTHLDPHVSDKLASLLDIEILSVDCFERYLGWHYVTRLDMPSDPDPTGRLRFEEDFIAEPIEPVRPIYLSDGGHPHLGDLYKLFYSMARRAERWDSNDRDGTGSAGVGGGSIRWHQKVDVAFFDAATVQVWEVPHEGPRVRIEPIGFVGSARILLPDRSYAGARWIRVVHDGTSVLLRPKRIEGFGQIADVDCERIAADLMPAAIAHTAALYRLFWRDTHPGDTSLDATVRGDIDGDGFVTILDVLTIVNAFGLAAGEDGFDPCADLDGSGRVDVTDLLLVVADFGWTRWHPLAGEWLQWIAVDPRKPSVRGGPGLQRGLRP
jgi:hypothetical protein